MAQSPAVQTRFGGNPFPERPAGIEISSVPGPFGSYAQGVNWRQAAPTRTLGLLELFDRLQKLQRAIRFQSPLGLRLAAFAVPARGVAFDREIGRASCRERV